eukprot:1082091-Amphidinium_carterae.1
MRLQGLCMARHHLEVTFIMYLRILSQQTNVLSLLSCVTLSLGVSHAAKPWSRCPELMARMQAVSTTRICLGTVVTRMRRKSSRHLTCCGVDPVEAPERITTDADPYLQGLLLVARRPNESIDDVCAAKNSQVGVVSRPTVLLWDGQWPDELLGDIVVGTRLSQLTLLSSKATSE